MTTAAIIVAAGSGSRFNPEKSKQFVEIKGKPIIVHTLERLQAAPSVDAIVLVLAEDQIAGFESNSWNIPKLMAIVAGGSTRAESVRNGLNAVDPECEIVAVHDGGTPPGFSG